MTHKSKDIKISWYYDACALGTDVNTYSEIINHHNPKKAIVSHLALGEAYGNIFIKKGQGQVDAFCGLIESLREYIDIVGNDGIDDIFDELRGVVPRISITDLTHVATAIKNGCSNLRTLDSDLYSIGKPTLGKIAVIAKKYNVHDFSMSRIK